MKHASLVLPAIALLAAPAGAATESVVAEPAADGVDLTSLLFFGIGAVALIVTHRLNSHLDRRD